MGWSDELAHLMIHAGSLASFDPITVFYGKVTDYDAVRHAIRAEMRNYPIINTETGEVSGYPSTPWINVSTGNDGEQHAIKVGTQICGLFTEKGTGPGLILGVSYTDVNPAPDSGLKQGEYVYLNRATGNKIKFYNNDVIEITKPDGSYIRMFGDKSIKFYQGSTGSFITVGSDGSVQLFMGASGNESQVNLNADGTVHIQDKGGSKVDMNGSGGVVVTASVQITLAAADIYLEGNVHSG